MDLIYKGWFNQYTDVDGTQRRLFGEMARETDPARIVELMDEFQEYFYLDAIFLTIGEFFNNWAARNDLEACTADPEVKNLTTSSLPDRVLTSVLDGSVIRPVQRRVGINNGRQMSETGLNAGWLPLCRPSRFRAKETAHAAE